MISGAHMFRLLSLGGRCASRLSIITIETLSLDGLDGSLELRNIRPVGRVLEQEEDELGVELGVLPKICLNKLSTDVVGPKHTPQVSRRGTAIDQHIC